MNTTQDYNYLKREISVDNEYTYIHDISCDCGEHSIHIKSDSIQQKVISFDRVTLQNVTLLVECNVDIHFINCNLTKVHVISNKSNTIIRLTSNWSVLTQCRVSLNYNLAFLCVNIDRSVLNKSSIWQVTAFDLCTSECNSTQFKWCCFDDCTRNNFTKCEFVNCESFTARTECSKFNECSYSKSHCFYLHCPETGSYIAYKKAKLSTALHDDCLIKLSIPEDALRSTATGMKCRASKAQILDITDFSETTHYNRAISSYDYDFIYNVGETIEVTNFDKTRWNECAAGIHHFLSKQEAIDYHL